MDPISSSAPYMNKTPSVEKNPQNKAGYQLSKGERLEQLMKVVATVFAGILTLGTIFISSFVRQNIQKWWDEFKTGMRKVEALKENPLKDKELPSNPVVKANPAIQQNPIEKEKFSSAPVLTVVDNQRPIDRVISSTEKEEVKQQTQLPESVKEVILPNVAKPHNQWYIDLLEGKGNPATPEIQGPMQTSVLASPETAVLPHLRSVIDRLKQGDAYAQKKGALLEQGLNLYLQQNVTSSMQVFTLSNQDKENFAQVVRPPAYFLQIFKDQVPLQIEVSEKFYDYQPQAVGESVWVDFANAALGGGCFTHGFVQEEIMVFEDPELADYIAKNPDPNRADWCSISTREGNVKDRYLVLKGNPTPLLLTDLHRVQAVNNSLAYGQKLNTLPLNQLLQTTCACTPAQKVHLLAIAAPKLLDKNDQIKIDTFQDIFNTLMAGFKLVKNTFADSVVNSGKLGCGVFNNNAEAVYMLHCLAAQHTETPLKLWGYSKGEQAKLQEKWQKQILPQLIGQTLEECLRIIRACCFSSIGY